MPKTLAKITDQAPIRKFAVGSKPLPLMTLPLLDTFFEYGANRWRDGVEASEDYRYAAMYEYLRLSPSFFSVLRHIEGKKNPYPLPDDWENVRVVVQDFRQIFRMDMSDWWRRHGKLLFGTPPPSSKCFVAGTVSVNRPSLAVMHDQNDAMVVRIAVNQSKKDALAALEAELDTLIAKGQFDIKAKNQLKAKYGFTSKRIRRPTLALGQQVLQLYQSKNVLPLWWIGNCLQVSPAMCLTPENVLTLDEAEIAYRKQVLGITTSRIVNSAMLIAENAARGRFPCTDPFPEAMTNVFERSVGRPAKAPV